MFAVVSNPRQGTHMLRTMLNVHPRIKCYGEIWNYNKTANIGDGVQFFKEDFRFATPELVMESLVRHNANQSRVVGFCVHRGAIERDPRIQQLMQEHVRKVIMLYREDLLAAFISLRLVKQRGNPWFNHPYRPQPLMIDLNAFRRYIATQKQILTHSRQRWPSALNTSYERTVNGDDRKSLLEYLEVRPTVPVAPTTMKQQTRPYEHFVTNYCEAREVMSTHDAWHLPTASKT